MFSEVKESYLLFDVTTSNISGSTNYGNDSNLSLIENNHHPEVILRYDLTWTVLLICAYSIVLVVGTVGNLVVVCVMACRPQSRTVMNMFILNLAVADLLVILFCVVPTLLSNILVPWIMGVFLCKAVAYVQGVSVLVSSLSLSAISFDRFLAIWYPTRVPRGLSNKTALVTIICTWLSATVIVCPWLFVFTLTEESEEGEPPYLHCMESWSSTYLNFVYFLIGNFTLCYALPLTVIVLTNLLIWRQVRRRQIPQNAALPESISTLHRKTSSGVQRMLTIMTLSFLLSWLPLYVVFFIHKMRPFVIPEGLEILIPLSQWLGISNSAVNPILYAFLNRKFRGELWSLLFYGMSHSHVIPEIGVVRRYVESVRRTNSNNLNNQNNQVGSMVMRMREREGVN